MTDDQDLHAVRALAGSRTTATDLTDLRQRVLTQAPVAPRRGLIRWAVPALAAAVALALVAGGSVLLQRHQTGLPPAGVVPSATAPPIREVKTLDLASTITALENASARAEPVTLKPGDQIYLRVDIGSVDIKPGERTLYAEVEEEWFEPNGMIEVRDLVDGTPVAPPKGSMADQIAAWRADFAQQGPGPAYPTPAWLATLPHNPAELDNKLHRPSTTSDDKNTALWGDYLGMFTRADPLLPPGVRAALFHLMGALNNVTAVEVSLNGTTYDALSLPTNKAGSDTTRALFDPATGHLEGVYSLQDPMTVRPSGAPEPSPGQLPYVYLQRLYTFQVVHP